MKPVQLNQRLIEKQGLTQQEVWKLQDLHNVRRSIEVAMEKTIDPQALRSLFQDWTLCQFELQKGWKFKEDANYHKGWLVPNCGCPVIDNEDRYPFGPYVINMSCPVHSKETLHEETKTNQRILLRSQRRANGKGVSSFLGRRNRSI